jgi:hypothetical protein
MSCTISFFYMLYLKTKTLIVGGDLGSESMTASHVAMKKKESIRPLAVLGKSIGCRFVTPSLTHGIGRLSFRRAMQTHGIGWLSFRCAITCAGR